MTRIDAELDREPSLGRDAQRGAFENPRRSS